MHLLCHYLNQIGEEAYMCAKQTNPLLRTPLLTQEVSQRHLAIGATPVAIYPEIVHGNPFGASLVVRYILNHPGLIGGPKTYDDSDLLVYYHEEYVPPGQLSSVPMLYLSWFDSAIFNNDDNEFDQKRNGSLIYAVRDPDAKNRHPELFANSTIITREWPETQQELAALFRKSKVLYCFAHSGVATEAALCGCPAVLMDSEFTRRPVEYGEERSNDTELWPGITFDASEEGIEEARKKTAELRKTEKRRQQKTIEQLENFIRLTKAMKLTPPVLIPPDPLKTGIQAFYAEDYAAAFESLVTAMTQMPQSPLPPAYLSFIAARQGDKEAAADFIAVSERLAPECADLKAALGESFLKAGNPDWAAKYLEAAITVRPDFLEAYPAYAQSLHLTGQDDAAIALLLPVVGMSSLMQADLQNILLEILRQRGDLSEFTRAYLRFSHTLVDKLTVVRALSHFETDGERLLETLGRIQQQLSDVCTDVADKDVYRRSADGSPLKIAFLAGDFAREARLSRLAALLTHLPPEAFITYLLMGDPRAENDDYANLCALLADHCQVLHNLEDAKVAENLREIAPDILIDLDAYGPEERLRVFLQADVPEKLFWGEAPLPPLSPQCRVLTGARLASDALPCVSLPEMGEYCDLPDLPLEASRPAGEPTRFACLTPVFRVERESWRLFAAVLEHHPASVLLLNLQDLGGATQNFIAGEFARQGIAAERLRFVHAHTAKDLCLLWREVDLGLAPPVDAGDLALPACLWMGRPYLALASPLPWSRRPAALLELAGAEEWIAQDPEDYITRARRLPPAPNPAFRARMREAGIHDPRIFAQNFAKSMTALRAQ
jgi:predicted O-linked N-acetylglucosamine transferase (SPINDLY family)